MKLKLNETLDQSLQRLINRTKQPSFNNNKGLTKIQQHIVLDTIDLLEVLLKEDKYHKQTKDKSNYS